METRRFPPPWSIDELEACFVARDQDDQQLAYVYFEDEPGRRSAAKLLTRMRCEELWRTWPSCRNFCKSLDSAPYFKRHTLFVEHLGR
jgi:hypothetical protein